LSDIAVVEVEGALTLTLSGAVEIVAVIEDLHPVEVVFVAEQGLSGSGGTGGGGNLVVSATDPGLTEPGLWIQTGLGDGSDMTFWVEDGT